jgi:hypothetical protein
LTRKWLARVKEVEKGSGFFWKISVFRTEETINVGISPKDEPRFVLQPATDETLKSRRNCGQNFRRERNEEEIALYSALLANFLDQRMRRRKPDGK